MRNRVAMLIVVAIMLSGCGTTSGTQRGVTFADEPINRPLPDDFKNRVFYKKTDIAKYNLTALVGRLLVCRSTSGEPAAESCTLKLPRIVKEGTTPVTKTPDRGVYTSKVNKGAQAQGSYLLFTAGFSATQVAEVTITDTSLVLIDLDDAPLARLRNYVKENPKVDTENRYWIQGVLLSTIVKKDYVRIGADASGVIGPVSGISGSVYQGEQSVSYDYAIALEIADIDRDILPGLQPRSAPSGEASDAVFIAPARELIIEDIKGLEQLSDMK